MVERPDAVQIGLCLSDDAALAHIIAALASGPARFTLLPDPAIAPDDWRANACAVAILDPFRMKLSCEATVRLARAIMGSAAILVVTPRDDALARTRALLTGADDAVSAMGDSGEIAARVAALLRRARCVSREMLVCDDLEIDLIERRVSRAAQEIVMPLREFDLLAFLARRANRPVSRPTLLRAIWNLRFDPGTNRVDVHMSRLRQRVDRGHAHALLRTIKGTGYALVTRGGAHGLPPGQVVHSAMQHV